jgi:EAL domain-containing protein (putative c-di-GMP-specific phosphodiesterase class I)
VWVNAPRAAFDVHFQPIRSVGTGAVVRFEALLRGAGGPAAILAASDRAELGWEVVTRAARASSMLAVPVAVNLDARTLVALAGRMCRTPALADQVVVEVTEEVPCDYGAPAAIDQLLAAGFVVALDDFATGAWRWEDLDRFPDADVKLACHDDALLDALIGRRVIVERITDPAPVRGRAWAWQSFAGGEPAPLWHWVERLERCVVTTGR